MNQSFKVKIFLFLSLFGWGRGEAQDLFSELSSAGIQMQARISGHDYDRYSFLTSESIFPMDGKEILRTLGDAQWKIVPRWKPIKAALPGYELELLFVLVKGKSPQTRLSLTLEDGKWSRENYLLMPAAAYNGNRFDYRRIAYSPKILDPRDIGPDKPALVSDIPKLNFGDGPSRIQERSGGMATPSVGYFNSKSGKSLWILFEQENRLGDYGVNVEENRDRSKATFSLTSPLVREGYKYRITDNRFPSPDRAADLSEGDSVKISCKVFLQPCQSIQQLYDRFFLIRKEVGNANPAPNQVTFTQAFAVQEHKFNTQNFVKEHGYYSVGMRDIFLQDWQIGWTGGMISTYPLLVLGADSTKKNTVRNFDWVFTGGISPSGFFWDSGEKGTKWYGGDIRKPHTKNWHLVRKSGDGLFFVLKQFMAMPSLGIEVKPFWKEKTRGVADAFVKLWKKNRQLGQFVDNVTGEIQVGGSASGSIVPAALVLASQYYKDSSYLVAAKEIAQDYFEKNVKTGILTGGPGDAMQNPDSESNYAMLESFMYLSESTGDARWLRYASDMSRQFSTWVSSYNYRFPGASLFGKIGIHSTGAVGANTQNKHGAPAICTQSGLGLLKLYLATGDTLVLNLLRDIAHNLPQYMGTPERPIPGVKNGWVCERVSTTDWLEGIGEITYQSTWAETGLMLTTLEIPGLLIEPDRKKVTAFDQVEARFLKTNGKSVEILLKNPTQKEARVRYFVAGKGRKIEEGKYQTGMPSVVLNAGEERKVRL
jgi:hypothetical protein